MERVGFLKGCPTRLVAIVLEISTAYVCDQVFPDSFGALQVVRARLSVRVSRACTFSM